MLFRSQGRLGRAATLAILPLMAIAIYLAIGSGGDDDTTAATFEPEGVLVIADLAGESLVIHDAGRIGSSSTLALPGPPHEFAVVEGRVYVTLGRGDRLVEVDPYAPGILRTLDLPGRPHGIAAGEDGELLVGLDDRGVIAVVDTAGDQLTVTDDIEAGDTPHMLTYHQGDIFVTASRDNELRAIRDDGTQAAPAGDVPEAVAAAGSLVAVGSVGSSTLALFDAATLEPLDEWSLPGSPVRLSVVDSTYLAASLKQAGETVIIDLEAREEIARVESGSFADGLCQSPSGDYLGVVSNGDGVLTITAVDGWEPLGTLYAGTAPGACAWLPD